MSPASYLTAPPRVATPSIASIVWMSSLTWGALGFFLFVLAAGTVGVAVSALGLWRRVKAFRAAGHAVFDDLGLALATLERRAGLLESESTDLQRALRRLDESL